MWVELGPEGAAECSYGWSAAEPVDRSLARSNGAPEGRRSFDAGLYDMPSNSSAPCGADTPIGRRCPRVPLRFTRGYRQWPLRGQDGRAGAAVFGREAGRRDLVGAPTSIPNSAFFFGACLGASLLGGARLLGLACGAGLLGCSGGSLPGRWPDAVALRWPRAGPLDTSGSGSVATASAENARSCGALPGVTW